MYADQALDVVVTTYMQTNPQWFGHQYAVLRVAPDFELAPTTELAMVAYRLINNRMNDDPIDGFPAGPSAEIVCSFSQGPQTSVEVPYDDGQVAYDLFYTVDADGSRCGYDGTVIATSSPTSVSGTHRIALGAPTGTAAWFDTLLLRRGL